jgi:cyclopropane fatty-acyl-phospholipid synthase-like methyltransferase
VRAVDEREIVAAGYDRVAREYAALEQADDEWPRLRLLRDALARLQPGSDVLDLGCGNGIPALREIACHHRAVGVDISETQINLARANVPKATHLQGDATRLDFPPESFDAVVALYLLDHIPRSEHARFFTRAAKWLRPSGVLLLSVEPEDEPGEVTEWLGAPMYFSRFDAETTTNLVRDAGFEILDAHREVQLEGSSEVEFLWILGERRLVSREGSQAPACERPEAR